MQLDFSTFSFNYKIMSGGGTPNWAKFLGQGKDCKISDKLPLEDILKGMIYSSVDTSKVTSDMGRGGNNNHQTVLASVFSKVFINDIQIIDAKFILLVIREVSKSHKGRLILKYGPSNTYKDGSIEFSNKDFEQKVNNQLGLAENSCWFVSEINVRNQDELRLKTVIVNKNGPVEYKSVAEQRAIWMELETSAFPAQEDDATDVKEGENIIIYGIPGCGKSYKIKTEYCNDEAYMERVVFHQDYTYSDFVGQILPQCIIAEDGSRCISYSFVAGPFTRILQKATIDSKHNYYLIIEEINRGNAPAIFGELFQLLDRIDGESEYGINNADIATEVYGNPDQPIKLPKNLFIIATMNTADQNVFTLDTAFKRRWKMINIINNFEQCSFKDYKICNTNITWKNFVETINDIITTNNNGCIENEDKRLGTFFVKKEELSDEKLFSEKVLMYLWNDAFKYNHNEIFKTEYKTLEQLISGFKDNKFNIFIENIF